MLKIISVGVQATPSLAAHRPRGKRRALLGSSAARRWLPRCQGGVMHKFYFAIAFLVASSVGNAADLGRQFVTAKLAYGASVSVPK